MKLFIFSVLLLAAAAVVCEAFNLCGVEFDGSLEDAQKELRKYVFRTNRMKLCTQKANCNTNFIREANRTVASLSEYPEAQEAVLSAMRRLTEDNKRHLAEKNFAYAEKEHHRHHH